MNFDEDEYLLSDVSELILKKIFHFLKTSHDSLLNLLYVSKRWNSVATPIVDLATMRKVKLENVVEIDQDPPLKCFDCLNDLFVYVDSEASLHVLDQNGDHLVTVREPDMEFKCSKNINCVIATNDYYIYTLEKDVKILDHFGRLVKCIEHIAIVNNLMVFPKDDENSSNQRLYTVSNTLKIFSLTDFSLLQEFDLPDHQSSEDEIYGLRCMDLRLANTTAKLQFPNNLTHAQISTGMFICCSGFGYLSKKIIIYHESSPKVIKIFGEVGHSKPIQCLQFSSNKIYSGSWDSTIRIWSFATGECLNVLESHTSIVRCLILKNDILFSGGWDKTIKIWDKKGKLIRTLNRKKGIYFYNKLFNLSKTKNKAKPIHQLKILNGKIIAVSKEGTILRYSLD